jgi:glutathione S-transferase
MEYLDERFPFPPLFPQDEEARQTVLAWIDLSSTAMRDISHHLYWQFIEPPEGGTDWAEVTRLRQEGLELLSRVEEALLSGGGWLTGVLSAADFSVFAWIYGYGRFGLPDAWEVFPNLKAWLERLAKRPSFAASYQQQGRPFSSLLRERSERHEC